MPKGGAMFWHPDVALNIYRSKLIAATERADAEGADDAREIAPLGKGEHKATGANPRFFSVKLQTTRDFNKRNKTGLPSETRRRARLNVLRSLNRADLASEVRPEDLEFFRFSSGSRKGERPDYIDVRPARGPGGEAVRGATTHYTPGRLRKGIHPIDVKATKLEVIGGYASEAPYSNVVEKGFHHKGGTEVAAIPFMRQSAENLRDRWNSGQFFEE